MSDDDQTTIFDLYRTESEHFEIKDGSGRSVKVKFLKRNEGQRRASGDYAREQTRELLEKRDQTILEMRALEGDRISREDLITVLCRIYEMRYKTQGLDLLDDVIPDEADDTPTTILARDQQRQERLAEKMEEERKDFESWDDEKIRGELTALNWSARYNLAQHAHMTDMTIAQTCRYAESGEAVFSDVDKILELQEETIDDLRERMTAFLRAESESEARRLASDPNSLTPAK